MCTLEQRWQEELCEYLRLKLHVRCKTAVPIFSELRVTCFYELRKYGIRRALYDMRPPRSHPAHLFCDGIDLNLE